MLKINEVLSFENSLFRILTILPYSVIWISLDLENAFPIEISRTEILKGLEDGNIERAIDPHESLAFIQPEKESIQEIKRDQNYALIYPLISHELFYIPVQRGKIISEIMNQHEVTKQTIYRLARRYWQRGQTPNALLPDYRNSGAKGQKRTAKDKKLGRPRIYNSEQGINVNEDIEKLFYRTIKLFFLKDNKHSLPFVYRKFQTTYKNFYPDIAESDIPTIWQFKYYYEKEFKKIESIKARIGTSNYRKDFRPLQSTSNSQALGPGARYEIDATIADIYLVSNSNPESIVGRPTIYFVIDVFSRLVAGFYIGFESPSYLAAIQALNIAMTDKVQYCAEYGISIQPEDWPAVGLPDALLADRGELLGYQIEALEKTFAVRLENAPARRGDAKGIVEQAFNTYQAYFKKEGKGKGVVEGTTVKKTGGNDYRQDATLNIHQFTEIILACIISHIFQSFLLLLSRNQINGWTSNKIWNNLNLSKDERHQINKQQLYRLLRKMVRQGHLAKHIHPDNSRLSTFVETESMNAFRKQFENHTVIHDSEKLELKTKELKEKQKICENQIKASEQALIDFPELRTGILRRKNQLLNDIEKLKAYKDFLSSLN